MSNLDSPAITPSYPLRPNDIIERGFMNPIN